jgi:hypothetical protein
MNAMTAKKTAPVIQKVMLVDVAPVGGDRRPPPRAVDVKQHRADCDQKQYECDSHRHPSLPLKATETN